MNREHKSQTIINQPYIVMIAREHNSDIVDLIVQNICHFTLLSLIRMLNHVKYRVFVTSWTTRWGPVFATICVLGFSANRVWLVSRFYIF